MFSYGYNLQLNILELQLVDLWLWNLWIQKADCTFLYFSGQSTESHIAVLHSHLGSEIQLLLSSTEAVKSSSLNSLSSTAGSHRSPDFLLLGYKASRNLTALFVFQFPHPSNEGNITYASLVGLWLGLNALKIQGTETQDVFMQSD